MTRFFKPIIEKSFPPMTRSIGLLWITIAVAFTYYYKVLLHGLVCKCPTLMGFGLAVGAMILVPGCRAVLPYYRVFGLPALYKKITWQKVNDEYRASDEDTARISRVLQDAFMIAVALPVSAVAPKLHKTQCFFWTPMLLQKGYKVASVKMQIAQGMFDHKRAFLPEIPAIIGMATLPRGILNSDRLGERRNATDMGPRY